jgi:PAS domain S-box-containing protein
MKKSVNKLKNNSSLRQKAEEMRKTKLPNSYSKLSEAEILKLVHELEVHQIELEMQNEELLTAKEIAEEASEKFTELYDFAPSGYFTLSREGKISELNLTGSQMLKKERSVLVNSQFGFVVTNETKPIFNLFLEKTFKSNKKESCEVSLLTLGNQLIYVFISGIVAENNNQCHVTVIDITELKQAELKLRESEERYRGLLNNLETGVIVHAPDTSVIFSNPKASEILGLNQEEIKGKLYVNLHKGILDENSVPLPLEEYPEAQVSRTKEPLKNFVIGLKRRSNHELIWLLVNSFPVLNQSHEITEIVNSFIDITELKILEKQLITAKDQAEAANKAKSNFLANMSHEIRTPLNGIIGFTRLLMKTHLDKNQLEYMSTVNESAVILMEIINDVLDFSKIESGKLELNIEQINLHELVNQVINLFKHQTNLKNIDLILNLDQNVPQYVFADAVRLKQILVNLIGNALKFTSAGKIQLDINELPSSKKNVATIQFSVKDTGIGIKQSNLEKIFNSFVQEDNSTSRKYGGTGLGLAISNQLLGLMHSKLELGSEYGKGSDFFFTINFKKSSTKKNYSPNLEGIAHDENLIISDLEPNILIVEDNKINMLLTKILVKNLIPNCTIFEASDGRKALRQFMKQKIDLILMDVQMPYKNGYEATVEIRKFKDSKQIPIIALTAGILVEEKDNCIKFGMNDYISKPVVESELERVLRIWLKK